MLKETPLYRLHIELGAKMAPFAGYQMPISYPQGIIHEHLHCRNFAGFFDISHMGQCLITGNKALDELERITPSNLSSLKPGQQKYTVLTNDDGGVIDDIIITRTAHGVMIVVNAACKDKDFNYLAERLSSCQFIELHEQALIALQGPTAALILRKYSPDAADLRFMHCCETALDGIQCTVSRSGYTGEDGFEISVANRHAETLARLFLSENGVAPIGLGARDTLRLEAGLCLFGHELNESITPVEAGLQWLIQKGRNDYPGAETIHRQLLHGPKKIRAGLIIESKQPVREGCTIYNEENDIIGHVTSGSFSPSLGKPIAMALIDPAYSASGDRLFAKVRENRIAVTVATLPFIPHRYQR